MSLWKSKESYKTGDIVIHDKFYFKCAQSHNSIDTWYPCIDTLSLWEPYEGEIPKEEPKPKETPKEEPKPKDEPKPKETPKVKSIQDRLKNLLSERIPLGTYFQSWSSAWASDPAKMDLANVKEPCNIVYLSFAKPDLDYKSGAKSLKGTGLDFNSDFKVLQGAIKILKDRGVVVMLAIGGETYGFDKVNYDNVAALCKDLGCHGIDIDWEDKAGKSADHKLGPIIDGIRQALPDGCVSLTGLSVGAYGNGKFSNSKPSSQNTGMCIKGLQKNGYQVDWVNIMSYDAGPTYSPVEGFDAYSSYYSGPIMVGAQVPPEAWGGNVVSLNDIKKYADHIKTGYNGIFVWSYQKQGSPSNMDIINMAKQILSRPVTGSPPSKHDDKEIVKDVQEPIKEPIKEAPMEPIKEVIIEAPTIVTPNTTILAPYLYTWGYNNDIYNINKCMDIVEKVRGNAATIAFVIGQTVNDVLAMKEDIKEFKKNAGQIIISFGGASGQYMENVLSVEDAVTEISRLIDETDCKALDFDIEGAILSDHTLNAKRSEIIVILQKKYAGLHVQFTLPADLNGLTADGIHLVRTALNTGVDIAIVNIMAMDIGPIPAGMSWGTVANRMGEVTTTQLHDFYPEATRSDVHRKLGITVMIGKNDDGSVFTPADASVVGSYAKENNIGLLSFWAINRDQVGTGNLGIYSQVNSKDYEFYINMKRALGSLGTLPNANYVPPPAPKDTWASGVTYKVGDKVFINGKKYAYATSHTSNDSLKPDANPALWSLV